MLGLAAGSCTASTRGSKASGAIFIVVPKWQRKGGGGANERRTGAPPLLLKYICCRGSSATCVAGRAAVSEPKGAEMLYDVGEQGGDWSEMRNLLRGDARAQWSETAEHMRTMLPPEFSAGCREAGSIK